MFGALLKECLRQVTSGDRLQMCHHPIRREPDERVVAVRIRRVRRSRQGGLLGANRPQRSTQRSDETPVLEKRVDDVDHEIVVLLLAHPLHRVGGKLRLGKLLSVRRNLRGLHCRGGCGAIHGWSRCGLHEHLRFDPKWLRTPLLQQRCTTSLPTAYQHDMDNVPQYTFPAPVHHLFLQYMC